MLSELLAYAQTISGGYAHFLIWLVVFDLCFGMRLTTRWPVTQRDVSCAIMIAILGGVLSAGIADAIEGALERTWTMAVWESENYYNWNRIWVLCSGGVLAWRCVARCAIDKSQLERPSLINPFIIGGVLHLVLVFIGLGRHTPSSFEEALVIRRQSGIAVSVATPVALWLVTAICLEQNKVKATSKDNTDRTK